MFICDLEQVCASRVEFDIREGRLRDIVFTGGCPGNLSAIALLLEGQPAAEATARLAGIRCGGRDTSCSGQFAKAIKDVLLREGRPA